MNKVGLALNLLGSTFLALHIIGIDRLQSFEKTIKDLPSRISSKISTIIIIAILGLSFRWTMASRKKETLSGIKTLINQFKRNKKFQLSINFPFRHKNPFIHHYVNAAFRFSSIILPLCLMIFLPVIVPLFILTKTFSHIQDKTQTKTFLGLIGILLLIIGFFLQFLSS